MSQGSLGGRRGQSGALQTAFSRLLNDRASSLLRTACMLEGGLQGGEELLQGALARTWAKFDPGWSKEGFAAYVRAAMINSQRSRWRRSIRELPTEDDVEPASPDSAEIRVDDADRLARALGRLPEGQRAAIVLRYYEDLSERDVADTLGCTIGNVKSQTARAVVRLRALLAEDMKVEATGQVPITHMVESITGQVPAAEVVADISGDVPVALVADITGQFPVVKSPDES